LIINEIITPPFLRLFEVYFDTGDSFSQNFKLPCRRLIPGNVSKAGQKNGNKGGIMLFFPCNLMERPL